MANPGPEGDKITVILPPEPRLDPEAARILLRILLKASENGFGDEYPPTSETS